MYTGYVTMACRDDGTYVDAGNEVLIRDLLNNSAATVRISTREDEICSAQFASESRSCHIAHDTVQNRDGYDPPYHVCRYVRLEAANIAGEGSDHAVQISQLDTIGIDENELSHTQIGELFGSYGTGATHADYGYKQRFKMPLSCRTQCTDLAVEFQRS